MKRPVLWLCLFLFAMVNLYSADKLILKVFELPDPKKTDAFTKADQAVIDAFQKKYPYIELRSFTGLKIENLDLDAAPLMAIAGGVSPDIIYVNFRQSATYIEKKFLYPMDEFVNKITPEEMSLRVTKPVMPVIYRSREGSKEQHYWMLPYETLVRVLLYRKDLFLRNGLDPAKPPRNWQELLEYAKIISNPQKNTYGIVLASGPQAAYDWITYIWSAGGEAVKQDLKTGDWYGAFDSPEAVKAMNFYLKLIATPWTDSKGNQQYGYSVREGDWGNKWLEGRIGMRLDYMNEQSLGRELDPNLYGIAPVPLGPTGIRGSELNCRMMGIFSGAGEINNGGLGKRDPKLVKDAAFKYIWFYDSEEARKIRMQVMIENGYGKMLNPILLKRYGFEDYLKFSPPGWLQTFEEALSNGKPEPYGRNTQKIYEYMSFPLNSLTKLVEQGKLKTDTKEGNTMIASTLKKAVANTNEQMLGKISSSERYKRNRLAAAVGILIFALFLLSIYKILRIFSLRQKEQREPIMHNKIYPYLIILPALLSIVIWKYLPLLLGSMMAFQNYNLVGPSDWIGFQNFADVLFDPAWWSALGKTVYYMALSLTLGFFPPVLLAILLQEVSRGKLLYRLIYYLPAVVSGVIVIYLWKLFYAPSDAGVFNQILLSVGLPKLKWLDEPSLAMILIVLPSIWAGVGPGCLIYLAALKSIPDDLYEAADLDGAGFKQKIRHIVLPYLKALLIIQFIAAFIASAQQSGLILIMTFGGPNNATKVADLLIFEKAYLYLNFGLATAMAWMLGIIMMGFTIIQIKKITNMEFKSSGQ